MARSTWRSFSPGATHVVTVCRRQDGYSLGSAGPANRDPVAAHESRCSRSSSVDDGKVFVTTSDDYTARLWSTADGRHISVHSEVMASRLIEADISPDGRHLATASADGTGRIWRLDGSGETGGSKWPCRDRLRSIVIQSRRPDGRHIVERHEAPCSGASKAISSRRSMVMKAWSIELAFDPMNSPYRRHRFGRQYGQDLANIRPAQMIETLRAHETRVLSAEFSQWFRRLTDGFRRRHDRSLAPKRPAGCRSDRLDQRP